MQQELDMLVEAAEELKNLKDTLVQQQEASARIKAFTTLLQQVTEQIARIPAGLAAILDRTGVTEAKLVAAGAQVVALRDSIPEIVTRIERSDVGRSIDSLSASIAESRSEFQGFREMVLRLEGITREFQTVTESTTQKFGEQLQQNLEAHEKATVLVAALRAEFLARFDAVQARVDASESRTQRDAANHFKVLDSLRSTGESQVKLLQHLTSQVVKLGGDEMGRLREEIAAIAVQLEKQGNAIDVLSKRKGFTF
ncbi:hypothetical protein JJQ59_04800 [Cupriavidus necator]|nr:hypothetical protein [Cupriavidus necator]QQX85264.1 hypothetical protein JJQ59_04800 [Cupriavidus necator]